jgi:hypothetical protein
VNLSYSEFKTLCPGVRLKLLEELEHRGIDLRGPLLLRPVAASWEHGALPELGHDPRGGRGVGA